MAGNGRGNRIARVLAALLLATCVAGVAALVVLRSAPATAEEGDPEALKTYWQGRYRKLRVEEARLIETARLATKEYADSNRRNYRRSGVRHFHRTNANEAKKQLAIVREQIETMRTDIVAAGGSVHWLDEVDEEPIDPNRVEGLGVYQDDGRFGGKGAYAPRVDENDDGVSPVAGGGPDLTTGEGGEGELEDDGRNPLYSDDEDESAEEDPASIDEGGFGPFDYEYWRTNREEYERERAPERHLSPDDY